MRSAIGRSAYLLGVAITLAYMEVQIEGPNGWASALPTWRTTNPWFTWVFGGRPVTGYHVSLTALLLLLLHWPIWFRPWRLADEARVLQAFAVLAVVWDFLWFILNPHFGLERFGPHAVWWYRHWVLGVPVDYWVGCGLAVVVRVLPAFLGKEAWRPAIEDVLTVILVPIAGAAVLALLVLA